MQALAEIGDHETIIDIIREYPGIWVAIKAINYYDPYLTRWPISNSDDPRLEVGRHINLGVWTGCKIRFQEIWEHYANCD